MKKLITLLLLCVSALAQNISVAPLGRQTFFDDSGKPLSGGKVYTFIAGTSTPQASYSDANGTLNTNPVILDSAGRASIWIGSGSYKFVVQDSGGATLWTADNIQGIGKAADAVYARLDGTNLPFTGTVSIGALGTATSGTNYNSNNFDVRGSYWNGSAAAADDWILRDVLGTGTNPTSTLTVTHSGSSGALAADFSTLSSFALPSATTPQLTINGDTTMNAAPRMVWSAGGAASSAGGSKIIQFANARLSNFKPDKDITVTRVQVLAVFGPTGCSTQGGIVVTDGTTVAATITFANGTASYDSGALSVNYNAAADLRIQTGASGAAGCSEYPSPNVTVQYKMR